MRDPDPIGDHRPKARRSRHLALFLAVFGLSCDAEAPKTVAISKAPAVRKDAGAPKTAAASKEEIIREELARLQGPWQMVSAIREGTAVAEARVKKTTAEIKGDALTVKYGFWTLASGVKFEIDPTKSPKWMTEIVDSGDLAKQNRGIYLLEGDRLTICVAATGKPRPTAFESKAGSGVSLRIFQKAEAKK